ncbi:AlpA family transcriptional regulator [Proteus mirabilis]|nr:AlpA family transcriptional regulator [Proteus mirabilis]
MPTIFPSLKESLIRLPEVMRRTGFSKPYLYKLISDDKFPKQVKIGSRSIAFVESEVDEWIANKIAESRSGEVV